MKVETESEISEPQLDRPGAGLPAIELFIARRMVASKYRKTNREEIAAHFERERELISATASGVGSDAGTTQVLVKRQRGMEDSSRFWSVSMVVDHLRIVNDAVAEFIALLGEGRQPGTEADTASVKPSSSAGSEVIEAFNASCARVASEVAVIENLNTEVKHPHPWFGPFDAGQWHHMAAFHMALHRGQIEAILAKLND